MNSCISKIVFCILSASLIVLLLSKSVFAEEKTSDFELVIQEPILMETAPGETASFQTIVKNNGNSLENFTIDIDKEYMPGGLPNGWKIEFVPENFNISSNNEKAVNINITSIKSSNFGDYKISINVTSLDNNSAAASIDNCTVRISYYKPDIVGDTHLDTFTGNFVHVEELKLRLKNRGNSEDMISSEIKGIDSPLYAHWTGAKPEALLGSNNESGNYILRVRIAENTPYSDLRDYEIQLYVNSSKDPSKNEIIIITVFVEKYGNLSLNFPQGNKAKLWLNKGSKAEFDIEIKNTGNSKMSYIVLYNTGLPLFWTSVPNVMGSETTECEQDSTIHFVIKIDVPLDVEQGIYDNIKFKIRPKEKSNIELEIILCVEIMEYYNVDVTEEILDVIYPGVSKELNLTVKNIGSTTDNFTVRFYSGDFEFATFTSVIDFELVRKERINVMINISPPDEPIENIWRIIVKTKSEHSGELGYDVIAFTYINLSIMPYYKPRLLGDTVENADTHGTLLQYYTFYLRIQNEGSGPDTLSMEIDKVEEPLTGYWEGSQPFGDLLEPDEISQINYQLRCEIPPKTNEKSYNLSVWINSTNDPSKNHIVNFTLYINRYYEIRKSIHNETVIIELEPPYLAIFKVNITNEGNKKMDLRLKYQSGLESRWNSDPGTAGRLLSNMECGETRTEIITITIDDETDEGVYENIRFKIYPEDSPLYDEEIAFTIEVLELHKIRLRYAAATAGTVEPVEGKNKVPLAVDVYNDGNVDDDILLRVQTTELYTNYPDAIKWDELDFYSNEDMESKITSIDVNANDKETVYLGVEIPSHVDDRGSVAAGSYIIPIYGESKEDPTANDDEDVPMIIKKVSEVNVEYTGGRKKIDPGETVSFVVKVENYGNEKDEMTFDVIDTYDWSHRVDDFYKKEFTEGEKREITVNITIPFIENDDTAEAGNYDIRLQVKPKSGGTKQEVKLDFEITESYGTKIELIDSLKNETLPGEGTVITYKAKISNLGNSDANIKVPAIDGASNLSSGDFDKWDVFLETSTSKGKRELDFSIKPTESREITVKVEIHEGGYINTYSMLLRAYPEGKSQYEAYPQRFWLTLREPIYKLLWTDSSRNQNKEVEPEKDTEMEYTVYVENLGTEDDTVTVRVEPLSTDLKGWEVKFRPPAGEESTTLSDIKIGDGNFQIFKVVVRPDERADRDVYDIELTVESEVDNRTQDRLLIQTTVKRPDLEIYAEDIILPLDVIEGDLAQIRATITNVGNAKARDVEVTFYDNIGYKGEEIDSTSVTIPVGDSVTVTGDWDVDAGKYYITVVVDENEEIVESNEGNNKATAELLDVEGTIFQGSTTKIKNEYLYIRLKDPKYTIPKDNTQFEIFIKEKNDRFFDILIMDSDNFEKYKNAVKNKSGNFEYYTDSSFLNKKVIDYRFEIPKREIFYLVIDNTIFPGNGASPIGEISVEIKVKVNRYPLSSVYSTDDTTFSNVKNGDNEDMSINTILIVVGFLLFGIILIIFSIFRRRSSGYQRYGYIPPPEYFSKLPEAQPAIIIPEEETRQEKTSSLSSEQCETKGKTDY